MAWQPFSDISTGQFDEFKPFFGEDAGNEAPAGVMDLPPMEAMQEEQLQQQMQLMDLQVANKLLSCSNVDSCAAVLLSIFPFPNQFSNHHARLYP